MIDITKEEFWNSKYEEVNSKERINEGLVKKHKVIFGLIIALGLLIFTNLILIYNFFTILNNITY